MAFDRRRSLASPSGAALNLYSRMAKGDPRATVVICHGVAEHAARYGRFADAIAAAGYSSYAHDHRGHGGTRADDAAPMQFGADGVEQVLADLSAVIAHVRAQHAGTPIILLGHSMGGMIATAWLTRHAREIDGAAIWNCDVESHAAARLACAVLAWERMRLGSDVPSRILPSLTFRAWARQVADRRTDFDWLSRDEGQVDAYIADPLCGADPTVGLWRDLFGFILMATDKGLSTMPRTLPLHLVGGGGDPATGGGRAIERLAARLTRLGFLNLVSTVYPRTRHESLNELNRDLITADFIRWADRVTGQPDATELNK